MIGFELFQSLFFWKWGFKLGFWHGGVTTICSFNPCFSGSGVLSPARGNTPLHRNWFQSLFFWKWGFKFVRLKRYPHRAKFQSLFFWKWGFKQHPFLLGAVIGRFQSLFFWKWGFKQQQKNRILIIYTSFNPCFSGSGVLRRKTEIRRT